MAGIANLFALIDQLKRNVGRNLQDPMGAVELGLLRADENFKADPVNTVLGNANIGGGLLGMTKAAKGVQMPPAPTKTPMSNFNQPGLLAEPALDTSYRIAHTAPMREGANTLDDLPDIFPDDVYNPRLSWQYYGHGDRKLDEGTARIIAGFRGKPDAEVTIYRAVPKGVKDINPGDWVTVNKDYAKMHGSSWVDDGNYEIISKRVKAKEIATDGNSIHEFGYSPLDSK